MIQVQNRARRVPRARALVISLVSVEIEQLRLEAQAYRNELRRKLFAAPLTVEPGPGADGWTRRGLCPAFASSI